ncbi:hypothetical protein ACMUMQ_14210 [Marinomonas sp. 2405UD66-6]|uniref:hypothetical protein n=1 Tax=Marinomonas sp. 2405UD66-6 TaxID=3391834 RepID=UPI0039C93E16
MPFVWTDALEPKGDIYGTNVVIEVRGGLGLFLGLKREESKAKKRREKRRATSIKLKIRA